MCFESRRIPTIHSSSNSRMGRYGVLTWPLTWASALGYDCKRIMPFSVPMWKTAPWLGLAISISIQKRFMTSPCLGKQPTPLIVIGPLRRTQNRHPTALCRQPHPPALHEGPALPRQQRPDPNRHRHEPHLLDRRTTRPHGSDAGVCGETDRRLSMKHGGLTRQHDTKNLP